MDTKDIIVKFRADIKDLEKGLKKVGDELGATSKEAEKQTAKWTEGFEKATKAGMAFGAAGLAVSAGINALIERNKELEKTLGKTSITTGIARDELRQMSMDAYDATTPLEEVTATLDALGRTGIKNADDMKIASKGILELADANDVAGDALVKGLSPALKAFNIDIKNTAAYSDILTYALNNTTYDFSEFSNILEKTAPKAQEVDLSFKGLNAVILALSERGVDGKTAITQITQALDTASQSTDESKDKLTVFLETLGLSPAEIGKYTVAMDDAAGITDKHAKNAQEAAGFSGKLTVAIDKLTVGAGNALAPFESLNTGLGAVSGTILAVASAAYIANGALAMFGITITAGTIALFGWFAAAAAIGLGIAYLRTQYSDLDGVLHLINRDIDGQIWLAGQLAEKWNLVAAAFIAVRQASPIVNAVANLAGINMPFTSTPAPYTGGTSTGTPSGGGGCFVAGTMIAMADGTMKPIEQVREGDMVLSFDPATEHLQPGRVSATISRISPGVITMRFTDGTSVTCTGEHPFLVHETRPGVRKVHERFVMAGELRRGDQIVRLYDGEVRDVAIADIINEEHPAPVYNFNVEPHHTYIASECLVHNVKTMMAEGGIVTSPTMALIGEAGPEAVIPLSRGGGAGQTIIINLDSYQIWRGILPHAKGTVRVNAGVR